MFAEPLQHFPSVEAREHHVQNDGVVIIALGLVETIVTRVGHIDSIAFLAQGLGEVAEKARLVFDDQDSHRRFDSTLCPRA